MPASALAHDVTPSVSEEPGGVGGAPPLPPGPSLTLGMTEVAGGEEPPTVSEVADVEMPAPAVAHDVAPSVSEEPGGVGGAPPLPPGPSLTLGMTETDVEIPAPTPISAIIAEPKSEKKRMPRIVKCGLIQTSL